MDHPKVLRPFRSRANFCSFVQFVPTPAPLACVAQSVCGPKPLWLPVVLSIEVISHNVCSYNCFEFKVSLRLFSRSPKFFPNDQRVLEKNSYWPSYRSVSPSRWCFEISFDYIRNIILSSLVKYRENSWSLITLITTTVILCICLQYFLYAYLKTALYSTFFTLCFHILIHKHHSFYFSWLLNIS